METVTYPALAYLAALRELVESRPGIAWADYATSNRAESLRAYRVDRRAVARDLADARAMLAYFARAYGSVRPESFTDATSRVTFHECGKGDLRAEYTAGQNWPTEYRAGVCAVLARALWDYFRDGNTWDRDAIVGMARNTFGPGIAARWFR